MTTSRDLSASSTFGATARLSRERLNDPKLWLGLQAELHLSDRERDIAIRLVLGDSLGQIATRFGIKKGTVRTYCVRIEKKAGARGLRATVVALLLASGLLLGD